MRQSPRRRPSDDSEKDIPKSTVHYESGRFGSRMHLYYMNFWTLITIYFFGKTARIASDYGDTSALFETRTLVGVSSRDRENLVNLFMRVTN